MAISVNTNLASLTAQKALNGATTRMNTAMERLSTGYRINSSKDDAAGTAVSTKLEYKLSSLNVAADNIQMGTALLDTAEGVLGTLNDNLVRIRDLTEQAANGTYGSDSLSAIMQEVQARVDEITRLSETVEFNGKFLLNGSIAEGIKLQVGIKSDDNSVITLDKSLFKSAAASLILNVAGGDITDKYQDDSTARAFLDDIDKAIANITERAARIGGVQQRLISCLEANEAMSSSVTSSLSTIQDADLAEESANYVKEQILQQISTSMLSTANQAPSIALNLI